MNRDIEAVRMFVVRRTFFVGSDRHCLFTADEYRQLKDRNLVVPPERLAYLLAFIDGYKAAYDLATIRD
jgi:hypothetical protein